MSKYTVEVYLHNVAQIFAGVGVNNPRWDKLGQIDFYLCCQLQAYSRANPLPTRVSPIPIALLHEC